MKKRLVVILVSGLLFACSASQLPAQSSPTTTAASQHASSGARSAEEAAANTKNAAAAHVTLQHRGPRAPDLLEHFVDEVLNRFDIRSNENTPTHFVIAIAFLVGALLLRRLVTSLFFGTFRKIAARTKSTMYDKLLTGMED